MVDYLSEEQVQRYEHSINTRLSDDKLLRKMIV